MPPLVLATWVSTGSFRVCSGLPSGAREGLEDWLDDRIEITDRDDWKSASGSTPGDGTMLGVAVAAGAGRGRGACSTTGRPAGKANRSAINGRGQRQANGHQRIELTIDKTQVI